MENIEFVSGKAVDKTQMSLDELIKSDKQSQKDSAKRQYNRNVANRNRANRQQIVNKRRGLADNNNTQQLKRIPIPKPKKEATAKATTLKARNNRFTNTRALGKKIKVRVTADNKTNVTKAAAKQKQKPAKTLKPNPLILKSLKISINNTDAVQRMNTRQKKKQKNTRPMASTSSAYIPQQQPQLHMQQPSGFRVAVPNNTAPQTRQPRIRRTNNNNNNAVYYSENEYYDPMMMQPMMQQPMMQQPMMMPAPQAVPYGSSRGRSQSFSGYQQAVSAPSKGLYQQQSSRAYMDDPALYQHQHQQQQQPVYQQQFGRPQYQQPMQMYQPPSMRQQQRAAPPMQPQPQQQRRQRQQQQQQQQPPTGVRIVRRL